MLSELRKKYPITIVEVDGIKVEITRTLGSGKTLVMLPGAQGSPAFCAESRTVQWCAGSARSGAASDGSPPRARRAFRL